MRSLEGVAGVDTGPGGFDRALVGGEGDWFVVAIY